MKISFVIPVYNVAPYLHECVRSIIGQSYSNIEIILVDDGSKDESPAICDAFANSDNRVKVIHKENGGLSDARNKGLEAATGEYVVFVDGDDYWLNKDDLEKLVEKIARRGGIDFLGFNCEYFFPKNQTYSKWVAYSDTLMEPVDGSTAMISLVKSGTFPMSACLKLLNRDFLLREGITFKVWTTAEDIPWFISVLEKTRSCVFTNQYVYAYRQNVTGSISNTGGSRFFDHLFNIFKSELERVEERAFTDEAKHALLSFLAYEYSILLSTLYRFDEETAKRYREEIRPYAYILRYTDNPKVKPASIVYRLFGFCATEHSLRLYKKFRKYKWGKK